MFRLPLRMQHIYQLFLLEEIELFKVLDSRMEINQFFMLMNYCFALLIIVGTIQ